MKKPKSPHEIIQGVIHKEISEEEYFNKRSDRAGRMIIDLPEINFLKKQPSLLRQFILTLSIGGRFRIILSKEMLGMQQSQFSDNYDIHPDTLRILKGQHKKKESSFQGKIREIVVKTRPDFELLATLAIMTRVPIEWLLVENPLITQRWNISHFEVVPHVYLTRNSFFQYLKDTREQAVSSYERNSITRPAFPYLYDKRPIILNLESIDIYLCASIHKQGDILIELFSDKDQLNDFAMLKEVLEPFYPLEVGYCKTVIDRHVNLMVLVRNPLNELSYPVEFIKL